MTVTPDEFYAPDPLSTLMDERPGLTRAALLDKLESKLEAMDTVFAKYEGQITDARDVIAHDVQLRALDMALKLRRMYPDPKLDLNLTQPIKIEIIDRFTNNDDAP